MENNINNICLVCLISSIGFYYHNDNEMKGLYSFYFMNSKKIMM